MFDWFPCFSKQLWFLFGLEWGAFISPPKQISVTPCIAMLAAVNQSESLSFSSLFFRSLVRWTISLKSFVSLGAVKSSHFFVCNWVTILVSPFGWINLNVLQLLTFNVKTISNEMRPPSEQHNEGGQNQYGWSPFQISSCVICQFMIDDDTSIWQIQNMVILVWPIFDWFFLSSFF